MPRRMPIRTSAWSTGSKWRAGREWRAASALADTGRPLPWRATSMTAAIARSPLRGSSAIRTPVSIIPHNGMILRTALPLFVNCFLPGRPETLRSTRGFGQLFAFKKLCAKNRRDDQLGNPLASLNRKRFGAEIHKNNLYFSPVVGIDRARRIQHRDAVARRQTGSRPYLAFGSPRQR